MNKKRKIISYSITIGALLVAIAHLVFPEIKIDGIVITLIIVAIVPWLYPLFKSLEFPGGLKFEFQELEKVTNDAKEVGLITREQHKSKKDYPFLFIANEDPGLALAGLRIEIEKRLRNIADRNNIDTNKKGLYNLLQILSRNQLISHSEESVLKDMLVTLNQASHGDKFDSRLSSWIIDYGPKLLDSLDGKIQKKVEAKNSTLPFNMDAWGHEKTEHTLETISIIIDDFNKKSVDSLDWDIHIKNKFSYALHNLTKLYAFFCDVEWDVKDPQIILDQGVEGFIKIKDRYNREFQVNNNTS